MTTASNDALRLRITSRRRPLPPLWHVRVRRDAAERLVEAAADKRLLSLWPRLPRADWQHDFCHERIALVYQGPTLRIPAEGELTYYLGIGPRPDSELAQFHTVAVMVSEGRISRRYDLKHGLPQSSLTLAHSVHTLAEMVEEDLCDEGVSVKVDRSADLTREQFTSAMVDRMVAGARPAPNS